LIQLSNKQFHFFLRIRGWSTPFAAVRSTPLAASSKLKHADPTRQNHQCDPSQSCVRFLGSVLIFSPSDEGTPSRTQQKPLCEHGASASDFCSLGTSPSVCRCGLSPTTHTQERVATVCLRRRNPKRACAYIGSGLQKNMHGVMCTSALGFGHLRISNRANLSRVHSNPFLPFFIYSAEAEHDPLRHT
jgi:hypothetical protein